MRRQRRQSIGPFPVYCVTGAQMGVAQVTYFKQVLVEVLMCASDECIMHGRSSDSATYSVQMWYTEDYKPVQTRKRHKGEHKITVSEI